MYAGYLKRLGRKGKKTKEKIKYSYGITLSKMEHPIAFMILLPTWKLDHGVWIK